MSEKQRKPDRRTAVTRTVIKDAMLALIKRDGFHKVTVASLCREAGVGRATFYTHYTGLMDVIDELADDAIGAVRQSNANSYAATAHLADLVRPMEDARELENYLDLLPVCQRVADDPRYRPLFRDDQIAEYIILRIFRQEGERVVPEIMADMGLTRLEAENLFLFGVMGAFAVNRSLHWTKDDNWYRVQRLLLTYAHGGYEAVKKLKRG